MLTEKLKARFGDIVLSAQNERDEETFTIDRDRAYDFFRALRDEPDFQFNFLTDVTAVDWLERKPRYDVVYQLNSLPWRIASASRLASTGRSRGPTAWWECGAQRTGSSANASTCSVSTSRVIPTCGAS